MLRPQVFALQEGDVQIGLICSEKQAIDATLISLEREDARFRPIADKYWNARGGSYTDGGAFIFSLKDTGNGMKLICTDKFGKVIETPKDKQICDVAKPVEIGGSFAKADDLSALFSTSDSSFIPEKLFAFVRDNITGFSPDDLRRSIEEIRKYAEKGDACQQAAIEALTRLADLRFNTGSIKRSSLQHLVKIALDSILDTVPIITGPGSGLFSRIDFETRRDVRAPLGDEKVLVIDAEHFEPEGDDRNGKPRKLRVSVSRERAVVRARPKEVLRAGGFTVGKTNVIAVEVPDRSGGLASVLKVAHQAELNVEYMYAFVNKSGSNAVLIFRFDDMDRAIEILQQAGFTLLTGPQICAL